MPITFGSPHQRKRIAWFNDSPSADADCIFTERDYQVSICTSGDLNRDDYISDLAAVIFTQNAEKPKAIARDLKDHAARLLDFDCLVIVRPPEVDAADLPGNFNSIIIDAVGDRLPSSGLSVAGAKSKGDSLLPSVQYFGQGVPWTFIANVVQSYDYRPAVNLALEIVQSLPVHSPSESGNKKHSIYDGFMDPLIRRAFSDCDRVSLTPLAQGRSRASVFCAHARITRDAAFGRTMQPFFVKIQDRKKTETEYRTYEQKVHTYLPFYLRPRLDSRRCCLGASHGLLVSDFISESESLLTCASKGRSTSALACLFDKTLLGWQAHATDEMRPLADQGYFSKTFPNSIDPSTEGRARELGLMLTLSDLRELLQCCKSVPVLVGPIQGDLHAGNVLVRGSDAILIDFGSHEVAPLLLDAAKLEASLVVEMDFGSALTTVDWLEVVKPLYEGNLLGCSKPQVPPESWASSLYSSIWQIRGYARRWQCERGQYEAAVSLALLEKAAKTYGIDEPELSRRAGAYVLAELVLQTAFGSNAKNLD